MSDIVKTAATGAVDATAVVGGAAFTAAEEALSLAASGGKGVINVGEKSGKAFLEETRSLFDEALERLRKVVEAAAEPLP